MNLLLFFVFALPEDKPKLVKEYEVIKEMQVEAMKSRHRNGLGKLKLNESAASSPSVGRTIWHRTTISSTAAANKLLATGIPVRKA